MLPQRSSSSSTLSSAANQNTVQNPIGSSTYGLHNNTNGANTGLTRASNSIGYNDGSMNSEIQRTEPQSKKLDFPENSNRKTNEVEGGLLETPNTQKKDKLRVSRNSLYWGAGDE